MLLLFPRWPSLFLLAPSANFAREGERDQNRHKRRGFEKAKRSAAFLHGATFFHVASLGDESARAISQNNNSSSGSQLSVRRIKLHIQRKRRDGCTNWLESNKHSVAAAAMRLSSHLSISVPSLPLRHQKNSGRN